MSLAWNALRADRNRSRFIDRGWPEDGERIICGSLSLEALYTPGHTPGCDLPRIVPIALKANRHCGRLISASVF